MRSGYLLIAAVAGLMVFAPFALAQENSSSNGDGTSVEQGARDIYHGTKAGLKDAAITTKVKTALLTDKTTKHYSIRVDTHGDGIVELSGSVPSDKVAEHAVQVANNVSGVRMVRNELRVQRRTSD